MSWRKKQQAGLRLDSRTAMIAGSDSGEVVKPGDPAGSPLLDAISYQDEPKMPPDGKLPTEAIETLSHWIKIGAPWPRPVQAAPKIAAPRSQWSFQPVRDPPAPAVRQKDWPRSAIDAFIPARLEREQLAPSPAADRPSWLTPGDLRLARPAPVGGGNPTVRGR